MRSARLLLATAAASAVLALGAPGAYAGDGSQQDSSSKGENSSSYGKDYGKEHHKEGKHGKHEWPKGGVHTGGGALTDVAEPGSEDRSGSYKEHGDKGYGKEDSWKGEHGKEESWKGEHGKGESWKGEYEKPHGGVHTGGGGLAEPTVTAGGLAVLAVAGAGLYAARRKKTGASVA